MHKHFLEAIEYVKQAEKLAPPGTHQHELYVQAALACKWPTIKGYAEVLHRIHGQSESEGK